MIRSFTISALAFVLFSQPLVAQQTPNPSTASTTAKENAATQSATSNPLTSAVEAATAVKNAVTGDKTESAQASGGKEQAGGDEKKSEHTNVTIDGVSAIAALVIAAFAVDRFATAWLFVLSLIPAFRKWCPEPGSAAAQNAKHASESKQDLQESAANGSAELRQLMGERRNRVVYFFFAAIGAGLVAWIGNIGILEVLGFKEAKADIHHGFDIAMTVLILTAGADRVQALMQLSGASAGEPPEPKPLEITGTLTIDGNTEPLRASVEGAPAE